MEGFMRELSLTGILLLAGASAGLAQAPRVPLSSIFRSKLAFSLPTPDSTPISTSVVVTSSNAPTISQNTWIEIHGTNLAQTTTTWSNEDFSNGLPQILGGVSATVNNQPAAIFYVSPVQINVLVPIDPSTGPVPVQVTTAYGTTTPLMSTMAAVSPAFLVNDVAGHVTSQHQADYSLLGPASSSVPGYTFTPAKPGEGVILYATGFGQSTPPITNQCPPSTPACVPGGGPLPTPWPTVSIGGVPATVGYAGLIGAGLYQINVTVPLSAPDGDLTLSATFNGGSTQNAVITIQH
jgi:uncharacterized protein (TIGR03437 family)